MPPKKDPNKPKGPTSAYLFYLQYKRREAKEAGKKVDFTKFSQDCSAGWKDMDEEDKADFFQQADEDKKRYQKEMESYVPPASEDGDSGRKRGRKGGKAGKKAKDKNAPKRAMSGFMFFCSAMRPEFKEKNPSASIGELAKKLGAAWNELSTDDRKPYEAKAKADQKRYKEEKEAYSRGDFGREDEEDVNEDEEESEED